MVKGYRTYSSCIAILLHQILNMMGFNEVTGEDLSYAIDIFLAVLAFIFRWLSNRPEGVKS